MKIKKTELLTNDLIETEKFYNKTLGFEIELKDDKKIIFNVGESKLVFKKTEIKKPIYHFAFNIPCNQLEQAIEWIKTQTNLILINENELIADFKNWNAKAIYFYDNNQNILEFIARFDLHNQSTNNFQENSILCISEIAIVTNNVLEVTKKLVLKNNFEYFRNSIPNSEFTPLGDDNGLIIFVNKLRKWYPTQISAQNFWTNVVIEKNNKTITLEFE